MKKLFASLSLCLSLLTGPVLAQDNLSITLYNVTFGGDAQYDFYPLINASELSAAPVSGTCTTGVGMEDCIRYNTYAINQLTSGKMANPTGTPTGNKAIRDDGTLQTIATILGYTPYSATNPDGFITSSALSPYLTSSAAASAYQPLDQDLVSIAGFSGTGLIYRVSANNYAGVTIGSGLSLNTGTLSATGGSGTVTSVACGTGLSGGTITSTGTCSLPNTGTPGTYYGVNGAIIDTQGRVTTVYTETCNDNVSRSLNSSYTVSSTKPATVSYSVNASWSLNALLTGSGAAYLEYSTNAGSSWTTVNQVSKGLNLLTFAGSDDMNVVGKVPANALVRLRTAATNMTVTYVRGQECY